MIVQDGHRPVGFYEVNGLVETSSRQSDMPRMKLGAGYDPRLPECWQPHCLCSVEFRILECRQAHELCDKGRRKFRSVDVDLIGNHDLDAFGNRSIDTPGLATP